MDDARFMEEALTLARRALEDDAGGPFGAVVVRGGDIVGGGRNRVLANHDATAHAEIEALRDASRRIGTHDLSGCVVYATSEPCPMCLAALYWARVDRLVYGAPREDAAAAGFDDARLYEELARTPATRRLRTDRAGEAAARAVIEAWRRRPDRRPY